MKPAILKALSDKRNIAADGKDLVFIIVNVADENGLTVPEADKAAVSGT